MTIIYGVLRRPTVTVAGIRRGSETGIDFDYGKKIFYSA